MKINKIFALLIFGSMFSSQNVFASDISSSGASKDSDAAGKSFDPWQATVGREKITVHQLHNLGCATAVFGLGGMLVSQNCGVSCSSVYNAPACLAATWGCVTICRSHCTASIDQSIGDEIRTETGNSKLE